MRTKIVGTIGPKSESPEILGQLVQAGLSIARMNFSHCSQDEYLTRQATIRYLEKSAGAKIPILIDLQGPRIRVEKLPPEGRLLTEGEEVVFTTNGTHQGEIHIDDPYLHIDIKAGDPLYLANGDMELSVSKVEGERIFTTVVRGGTLYSRKAVNVPRTKLTTSGLTEKDIADVRFGLAHGCDYFAISFVQSADDVLKLRSIVGTDAKIIAKIETAFAVEDIDNIIKAADGIMIARGDLGIEVAIEQVPFIQKNLIRHAAWYGKPSITATQMLMSMTTHPRPTRAEVSDIANAVWDGTDAVMLSDETASGNYPAEALRTMARVVEEAERSIFDRENKL